MSPELAMSPVGVTVSFALVASSTAARDHAIGHVDTAASRRYGPRALGRDALWAALGAEVTRAEPLAAGKRSTDKGRCVVGGCMFCTNEQIDTGRLPEPHASAVRELVVDLRSRYPGLLGHRLTGSWVSESEPLPGADLDLIRLGEPHENPADPRMSSWLCRFAVRGVLFDHARWIFGDLSRPRELGLGAAVALDASLVVWERQQAWSQPIAAARALLKDPEWVQAKFGDCVAALERTTSGLNTEVEDAEPNTYRLVWRVLMSVNDLVSAADLQPAGITRRALAKAVDRARRCGGTELEGVVRELFRVDNLDQSTAEQWLGDLEELGEAVCSGHPDDAAQLRNYAQGIAALLKRAPTGVCLWPFWRAFYFCEQALSARKENSTNVRRAVERQTAVKRMLELDHPKGVERFVARAHELTKQVADSQGTLRSHLRARQSELFGRR